MTTYVGDSKIAKVTFKLNGTLANPTSVTIEVRDPDGTKTTPTPTNDIAGIWETPVDFNLSGLWVVKFTGTGAVKAVNFLYMDVEPSEI